jgi:hypothetical protein
LIKARQENVKKRQVLVNNSQYRKLEPREDLDERLGEVPMFLTAFPRVRVLCFS